MDSPDSTLVPPEIMESSASASGKLKGLASGLGKGSGLFRWKVVPTPKREEPEAQMPGLTSLAEKRVKKVEDVSRDYEEWLRELRDKLWSTESKYKMEKVRVGQLTEQLKTEREAKEQLQQMLERDRAENSEQLQLLQAEGTRLREERDAAELIRDAADHERNTAVRDRDAIIEDSKVLVDRLEDLEVECEGLAEVSTRMHEQLQTVISERNEAREAAERVTREKDRLVEQLCALKRSTAAADARTTTPVERKRGRGVVAHKSMQVVVANSGAFPASPSNNLKNISAIRRQWQHSAQDSPTSSTPTTPSTEEAPPTPKLEDVSDEGSPHTSTDGASTATGTPSSKERETAKGEESGAPDSTQAGGGSEDPAPLAPSSQQKGEAREPVSATWRKSTAPSVYALQKTVMRLTGEKEELEQRMSAFKKEKLELVTRLRVAREAQKRLESSLRKVQPRSGSGTPEPGPPPPLHLQGGGEEEKALAAAAA